MEELEILRAHSSAKELKRKADEHYYNLKGDVDTYTRDIFNSCTDDDTRREVNQLRSSSGLLPLTWAKVYLPDDTFKLLISKVFSGEKVKSAIVEISSQVSFEEPLDFIVRQHHPYDWMDNHRLVIKCSTDYKQLISDLGLHKNANILANDKRPYTLLRRLERVLQKVKAYKAAEEDLRNSEKDIASLKAELKVIQMRVAMTVYDIEALKNKMLEEADPFERFKWVISEFPDITNRDLATYCGVTDRQVRRYRKDLLDSV